MCAKLPILFTTSCVSNLPCQMPFQQNIACVLHHLWLCGTGFGRPLVVPLVWKMMAASSSETSGSGCSASVLGGKVEMSTRENRGSEMSPTSDEKCGSYSNALPLHSLSKSRTTACPGSENFRLNNSGVKPALERPYRWTKSVTYSPVNLRAFFVSITGIQRCAILTTGLRDPRGVSQRKRESSASALQLFPSRAGTQRM